MVEQFQAFDKNRMLGRTDFGGDVAGQGTGKKKRKVSSGEQGPPMSYHAHEYYGGYPPHYPSEYYPPTAHHYSLPHSSGAMQVTSAEVVSPVQTETAYSEAEPITSEYSKPEEPYRQTTYPSEPRYGKCLLLLMCVDI
jgi:hypothetical protein